MKWLAKAALQKLLSALPAGEKLNYHLQRRLTKTLPRDRRAMLDRFRTALGNHQAARRHDSSHAAPATAYEFGAGWELGVALCLYMLGVERQVVVDLRPLLNLELLNDAMPKLRDLAALIEPPGAGRLRPLPQEPILGRADLQERLGITYLAPRDARATGLPAGSFDLISSSQVLEHIPQADLVPILAECRRLLSPRGVLCLEVDMHDHFHYFEPGIGPYNFLRFSPGAWRLINSGLHYQNRLRLPDYLHAVERAGLVVVQRAVTWPSAQDLQRLRALPLAAQFAGGRYRPYELAARSVRLVCCRAKS
ncbi:MAG: class I SAM-dependent methyltransferase [Desulfarculus sp.]|nr:class I SAM-dependent methyltransferase [Desulfarculus sp.]